MRPLGYLALAGILVPLVTFPAAATPAIPGLSGKPPLSEPLVGELLLTELRCLACHTDKGGSPLPERAAPDLADVGARVAPNYLRKFLAAPASAHPGTLMPDLLAGESAEQRDRIAEALTHFLVARSQRQFRHEKPGEKDAAQGKTLFHTVGCIACHSPRDEGGKETARAGAVGLAHLPAKASLPTLGEFLVQPARTRPSGRMPDMKLSPAEARSLAAYLMGQADPKSRPLVPQENLAAQGKKFYQQFNCAACHALEGFTPAAPGRDLGSANPGAGCLARAAGKAPRFDLSDDQTRAIRAALAKRGPEASDKTRLAITLTTFNCLACHVRDEAGGVAAEHDLLFQSTEKDLGEEGRIPPPLTLVGAKLQPVALKKVLFDGESVRPYMVTRMPQFGEANLRHLPELFGRLDSVKEMPFSLPSPESNNKKEREREGKMRAAGRELVGDKALNCIACHTFNGKAAGQKGMELLAFPQRLKPSWFNHFLRNPGAFRPRTVMPTSWPGGEAVQKTILEGDTDRQIEAIWYYLSLGTSAADPSGLRPVETILTVSDATRTYRGRSSVAGYRGIAVGFPDKLNYAFNAETGTLTALWRGNFVRVDRGGQGSGGFNPASPAVLLAQDVSFYDLPDERTPWPLRPVMTREAPANPDPLYPRNRGYQFKGYYLDDNSTPTFMYRSGSLEIEDRSVASTASKLGGLTRTLSFDAPKDQTVWFRALTGKIEAESKQRFKTPDLRLTVPPAQTLLRPTAGDATSSELLIKLDIPRGKSTRTITYELLR